MKISKFIYAAVVGGVLASCQRTAANSAARRILLDRIIESVVVVEKVLCVGRLVFQERFAAVADQLDNFGGYRIGSQNDAVGILHNVTAEVFVLRGVEDLQFFVFDAFVGDFLLHSCIQRFVETVAVERNDDFDLLENRVVGEDLFR